MKLEVCGVRSQSVAVTDGVRLAIASVRERTFQGRE